MASNKYGYMAKVGVDTTGMRQADTDMRNMSRELRDIDRLIEETGGTTELYAQRQANLAQQINNTTQRLQQLRNAQQAIENGVNAGTISPEQYRAYQREVANAQNSLERLQEQQRELGKSGEKDLSKVTNALKNIEKAALASSAAVAAALTKLSSDALNAYSQYEQLVGGVETLFSGAEDIVLKNAENAFKTAGISANNYMQTVTGFSATLLQGLEGDTKKAAEIADSALIDMADNANKMGTAMASIQYAYQGFAKQNYTMLDNLKLGYGGSQAEMARLINDSGVLNGQIVATANNVKEIPFDKIIEAIHKIQENLGITGTTALEAETTIEGSMNKLKASWENALVEIARPLDDFAMGGLTILNDNIDTVKETLVKLTEQLKPILDDVLAKLKEFIDNGGIEKLSDQFINLVEFVINNKGTLLGLFAALEAALGVERMSKIIKSFKDLAENVKNAGTAISNAGGQIDLFGGSCSVAVGQLGLYAAAIAAAAAAATAFVNSPAFDEMMNLFGVYIYEESSAQKQLEETTAEIHNQRLEFEELAKTDPAAAWKKAKESMNDLAHSYAENSQRLQELRQKIANGGEETETGGFRFFDENEMRAMREEAAFLEYQNTEISALLNDREDILNSYNEETIAKMEEAGRQRENVIAKQGQTNNEALAQVWDNIRATTKEKMDELDHDLATHKIDDSQYWAQRKEYLEKHRDEESEEWWKYYDSVTEHYEKAAETERKAAEKAASDAKKAVENSVKSSMENLKRLQKEQNLDDKWLEEQYLLLAESQKKGTDAYYLAYDAYLDIREKNRKEEQKQAEEDAKQRKKEAEQELKDRKKEAEDSLKELKKQHEEEVKEKKKEAEDNLSLLRETQEEYTKTAAQMSEKVTSNGKERLVIGDQKKESEKLRKYRSSMDKLKSLGLSDELIASVYDFDYNDGSRQMYINELLGMSARNRQKYDKEYQEYVAEQKKTAEYDTELSFDEQRQSLYDAANGMLEEPAEQAYQWGVTAGENYIKGLEVALDNWDNGLSDMFMMNTSGKSSSGGKSSGGTSANSAGDQGGSGEDSMQVISLTTPVVINVAGREIIRGELGDILREQILSGGG